ncbi:MAG TPA: FAD-dependent monooxygenase, partial [Beijerinckiaceae bacterium]|nr:FAD-dependent monooxygenase [Beijerinckiaceae bacterium]
RHSLVREKAGLAVEDIGAPMDALWMRLPRRPDDPEQPVGRFGAGEIYVMLNRGDYYQCALVIPKGGFEALKEHGLEALRARIAALAPFVGDRVGALQSWDDLKLLTVAVDRLTEWWRPGLLCIGDAAHAMSPVGGVGINLAVQDGVAAANILYRPLLERSVTIADRGRCSAGASCQCASSSACRCSSRTASSAQRSARGRSRRRPGCCGFSPACPLCAGFQPA